jgi:hypothetical protein
LKSGSLNLPEPFGPVQGCTGISILLLLTKHSANETKKNKMGGTCGAYWGLKTAYRDLVERPYGRRPLGRARNRWLGNIKMDFHEVGWRGLEWIALAQDSECGNEVRGCIKYREFLDSLRTS